MNKKVKRIIGILAYIVLIFLPLMVMLVFPMPGKREFWRELSVALGFVGLAMAGLQFLPTARIKFFADVFDLDQVYRVHHVLSVLSVFLVFLHPIILLFNNPYTRYLLNPFTAPRWAQAGWFGLAGLILIATTSVLRQEVKFDYNFWHTLHEVLALAIGVFALVHIFRVNYYLSSPAMTAVWIVEAAIWGGAIIYARVIKPLNIKKRPYKVGKIEQETSDTWSLYLQPDGHDGLNFQAAQVAWLNVNTSPFTLHRNPFSISNQAGQKVLRFSIKEAGDFTSQIPRLDAGSTIYVDGPYGRFSLDDPRARKGFVLLAGGIGSAPIMSILHTLADREDKRPVRFFYGNYALENVAFKKELDELETRLNLKTTHVLEKRSEQFPSETGFITADLMERELPEHRDEMLYFVCGPVGMIEAMKTNLDTLGIPKKQVEIEEYEMA